MYPPDCGVCLGRFIGASELHLNDWVAGEVWSYGIKLCTYIYMFGHRKTIN
jgi:hypothetical protein